MNERIKLSNIRIDGRTQLRNLDTEHVAELQRAIERQANGLPPIIVFYDGKDRWLGDGFHRYFAAQGAKQDDILADVREGTKRDALLYACGANSRHGLPRTREDKRRCVETLLQDAEWSQKSDAWIAEKCQVSYDFAAKIRKAVQPDKPAVRETKDGRKIDTTNIGRKEKPHSGSTNDDLTSRAGSQIVNITHPPTVAAAPEPEPSASAMDDVDVFDEVLNHLSQAMRLIHSVAGDGKEIAMRPSGFWLAQNLQGVEKAIKGVRDIVRFTAPHAICPYCKGKEGTACTGCRGNGWVTLQTWEAAPASLIQSPTK